MCFSKPPHFGNRGAAPVCMYIYIYTYIYIYIYVNIYVCIIYIYIYIGIYIYSYIYIYINTYIYIYININVNIYIYVYIIIHAYIYIRIYIHICIVYVLYINEDSKIELQNSFARFVFLCCIMDIKVAWTNPWNEHFIAFQQQFCWNQVLHFDECMKVLCLLK